MRKTLTLAFTVVSVFFGVSAARADVDYSVCPKVETIPAGVYDPKIKIKDVMYQFQDHLNAADAVAHAGKGGRPVTDADLASAADHAESARNCALLAVRNSKMTMIPEKTQELSKDKQEAFLENFGESMTEFSTLLGLYRDLFVALKRQPAESRNFAAAYDMGMTLDSFSTKSHRKF